MESNWDCCVQEAGTQQLLAEDKWDNQLLLLHIAGALQNTCLDLRKRLKYAPCFLVTHQEIITLSDTKK